MAKFDLQLTLAERHDDAGVPDGIAAVFTYATDLFDPGTCARAGGAVHRLLDALCAEPERAIGDITITTATELDTMLHRWNAEGAARQTRRCRAVRARRGPLPGPSALTYEVDARVRRTRRRATASRGISFSLGVGPETLVAVALPRSADSSSPLLAVIKSVPATCRWTSPIGRTAL